MARQAVEVMVEKGGKIFLTELGAPKDQVKTEEWVER
jgi:hypothetical protein